MMGAPEAEPDLRVVHATGVEKTVAMHAVRATLAAFERAGVARDRLLAAIGLEPAELEVHDARLPLSEVQRIAEVALEMSGDPAFGLHWAERLSVDTFAPVSYLVSHAANLAQGLQSLAQFARLTSDNPHVEVEQDVHEVRLRVRLDSAQSPRLQRMIAELAVMGFIRIVQCFSTTFRPERVCFEYSAPDYQHEYARVFDHAQHFDQPFTGIAIDRALLATHAAYGDHSVHQALRELAERRVSALEQRSDFAARARELLVQRRRIGGPAMIDVAAQLGLSVHALRRRLSAQGTTFAALENEAFAILVKQLLLDQQCSIQEAAYELGFSGTPTFHRAFKRAMGTTPGAFLEAQLGVSR